MESGDNALLPGTHRFLHSFASGFAQGASPRQVAHSVGMTEKLATRTATSIIRTRRAASSDPMAQFRNSKSEIRNSGASGREFRL
jgi:hypothetical protein